MSPFYIFNDLAIFGTKTPAVGDTNHLASLELIVVCVFFDKNESGDCQTCF